MLHLYNDKQDIPSNIKYIRDNEEYFRTVTIDKLDERVNGLLKYTDNAIFESKDSFKDRFNHSVPWMGLSTGGKTVLNVFYNEDCCFDTFECGDNAIADLKNLKSGNAYPNYIVNYDNNNEIDVIVDDVSHYTKFSYWAGEEDYWEDESYSF